MQVTNAIASIGGELDTELSSEDIKVIDKDHGHPHRSKSLSLQTKDAGRTEVITLRMVKGRRCRGCSASRRVDLRTGLCTDCAGTAIEVADQGQARRNDSGNVRNEGDGSAREASRIQFDGENDMKHLESQRDRILMLLKAREGHWVPLTDILALGIGQYNAQIKELRDIDKHRIENKIQRMQNGVTHSAYRLVPKAPEQLDLLRTA